MSNEVKDEFGPAGPVRFLDIFFDQGGTQDDFKVLSDPQKIRELISKARGADILYENGSKKGITIPKADGFLHKKLITDLSDEEKANILWLDKFREDFSNVEMSDEFIDRFGEVIIKQHESYTVYPMRLVHECTEKVILEKLGALAEVTPDAISRAVAFDQGSGKYLSQKNLNIFFVKDIGGEMCAVSVWRENGLYHFVILKKDFEYPGGAQVLSKQCSEEKL